MGAVSVPPELFDDDYLYLYSEVLGDERSDSDAEVVARSLALAPGMRVLDVPCGEGRIAGRVALLGCEVLGLDSNERARVHDTPRRASNMATSVSSRMSASLTPS